MTPVVRAALDVAPLPVARAPARGSGKSYLADFAAAITTGEKCPAVGLAPTADETEKRLVGAALAGQPMIAIDNRNGELRSEFLCQAVERPLLQVRPLGASDMTIVANAFTCYANGINIEIADDLVRRTVQCSLDPNMERPETRTFKNDPFAAIIADRGRYVAAVLTVVRAYVVADLPNRPDRLMSCRRWRRTSGSGRDFAWHGAAR